MSQPVGLSGHISLSTITVKPRKPLYKVKVNSCANIPL